MTTPETQEVEAPSYTEDEAASALLAKWNAGDDDQPSTEDEPQEEAESEQTEQVDAQDEAEPQEEPEESGEVEIDVGGEKFKIPASQAEQAKRIEAKVKEIEAGTTRKFQEAAELRKAAETQIQAAQQLQQIAHEQSDLIADHKMVERRLHALEQVDINALAEQDPVQLTKINAEYNQLISAKQRIEGQYQQSVHKSQELNKQTQAQKLQRLNDFAKKSIKGWSDTYSNTLMTFAVNDLGFAPDSLRTGIDEPLMRAIDLAYQGHKVRTADPKAKQVVNTKTLKPSGPSNKTTAYVSAEKALAKLGKTGRLEDAAMALLARSNVRKR